MGLYSCNCWCGVYLLLVDVIAACWWISGLWRGCTLYSDLIIADAWWIFSCSIQIIEIQLFSIAMLPMHIHVKHVPHYCCIYNTSPQEPRTRINIIKVHLAPIPCFKMLALPDSFHVLICLFRVFRVFPMFSDFFLALSAPFQANKGEVRVMEIFSKWPSANAPVSQCLGQATMYYRQLYRQAQ